MALQAAPARHHCTGAFGHYPLSSNSDVLQQTQRPSTVRVRHVTARNVREEVAMIAALLRGFPFVAVDTEYPGTVYRAACHHGGGNSLTAEQRYALAKANVDEVHLLQLGLTLCDARGRLPVGLDGGHLVEYAWQVDFSDHDPADAGHRAAPNSVAFLRAQGFDFDAARAHGVTAQAFARELERHGILDLGGSGCRVASWITFGGLYDAAYLLKLVTGGEPLPATKVDFLVALGAYFGAKVFDAKHLASQAGVRGGLRAVARELGVPPLSPPAHLAGPNSVVACRVFMELRRRRLERCFPWPKEQAEVLHLYDALEIDGLQDDGQGDDPHVKYHSFLPWRYELV